MTGSDRNTLYPVFLKLRELNLLIVGGGETGLEKVSFILKNSPDANITLIGKEVDGRILKLTADYTSVTVLEKLFEVADLEDVNILILATDNIALDVEIKEQAKRKNILVNVADKPGLCDFYLGSIVSKGNLKIGISTNGKSPTLAKRIREYLQEALPDNTDELIANLGEIRDKLTGGLKEKIIALNEITSSFRDKGK
jgi:precorrin-2 dehydrogenase/sirohydrochlorin ferrochelatase